MRWQRAAQVAIACFVIAFVALLVASMRRQGAGPQAASEPAPEAPPNATFFNPAEGRIERFDGSRKVLEIKFGKHVSFEDGRVALSDGVRVLTNRNGKDLVVEAREAEVKLKGDEVETAVFKRDVSLTTAGGIDVRSEEASYAEAEGIVKIPGPVTFKKGRMSGSGVGATYDRNREVLWILDQSKINVAAGADGAGAIEGRAAAAGLARQEHYMRLTKDATLSGEGRTMHADDITITLTEDDERVQTMQLRGNSRISGGAGGPQAMSAQNIDLMYGDDGRTLQTANLMENAVVEMPGAGRKRIAGNVINIGLAPNGSTVTHLSATENVQVDLPAEPGVPAKRIRSATLVANGAPESGLQSATFDGKVEYRETQAAARDVAAVNRTATSDKLVLETKPGLGAVQKADFRGNVVFVEAPDFRAEAPRAIYYLDRDRIELMPSEGDPGPPPLVSDGKIRVGARTINLTLSTRALEAETKVRSTVLATSERDARGRQQARVPSVLKQDEPVNITSNRLHYERRASQATYTGNVTMWQEAGGATIRGGTLVLDDKTGNLEAKENVTTEFVLEDTKSATGQRTQTRTTGKAQRFLYEEARRLATYTGDAEFEGAQGKLTADRILVFLQKGSNELERLEAFASGNGVTVREGHRTARGAHLTYTAADDKYLMIGTPVEVIEEETPGSCRVGTGGSLTFTRGAETGDLEGIGKTPSATKIQLCSTLKR